MVKKLGVTDAIESLFEVEYEDKREDVIDYNGDTIN
jgi:single-strand DNA-binding protein